MRCGQRRDSHPISLRTSIAGLSAGATSAVRDTARCAPASGPGAGSAGGISAPARAASELRVASPSSGREGLRGGFATLTLQQRRSEKHLPKFIRCGPGTFCCNGGFCTRMRFRPLPSNYGAAAFSSVQTSPANQRGFFVRGELMIRERVQEVMSSDDGPHGFSILYCCSPVRSGRAVHRRRSGNPS